MALKISRFSLGVELENKENDKEYITKLCHDMFAKTAEYLSGEFESEPLVFIMIKSFFL